MIALDDSADGRTLHVRVGERIAIALSENASTGYRWSLPPARRSAWCPTLREIDERFAAPGPGPATPGAPGVRRLVFEAAMAGIAEIAIEYRRAWQTSAPAARTFRLHVEVSAGDSR
jgi:inhibitor of cysteine peptidase